MNGNKSKNIIDPFCGSGTTLVEGILAEHNVIGIDIDPLSALISKVKTTIVDISKLIRVLDWLVRGIKKKKNVGLNQNVKPLNIGLLKKQSTNFQ